MKELAGIDQSRRLPGLRSRATTRRPVLEECAKFNEGVVAPLNWEGDKNPSSFPRRRVTTAQVSRTPSGSCRWRLAWGLQHPVDFGGQGLPKTIQAACSRDGQQRQHELRAVPAADRQAPSRRC